MKALICIPCLLTGGTEIQTLNTVHALVQENHEVTVACYFEHSPYMVERYRKAGAEVLLFSPEGTRVGGYRAIPYLYKHLRRTIKTVRPDVAHVQYMAPGAMVILLLRLLGVKNIIATAHTAADIYRDLRLIHFLQRRVLRAFTCITERAEHSFFGSSQLYTTETVLGKRNHFTIYNALPAQMRCNVDANVDANQQSMTAINQRPEGAINRAEHFNRSAASLTGTEGAYSKLNTIGVVSRLEPIKGMDLVAPAFAEVLKRFPEVRLLVVGDGSLRATMELQAVELGCADRITWVGRQPQEELAQWYDRMDIVLMPSRSEGFGLTAIEAMANGCVMVASNVGGLPEVVRDGVCGMLHRTENVQDMAAKVSELLGDNELYSRLRTQALCEVEKYSFERYAKSICDLYERLMVNG